MQTSDVPLGTLISLALYFVVMLGIGIYAYFRQKNDVSGYMLGGRQMSPAVTALSAGASDMSGWMLMGLPGYMYASGVVSIWIALGLTIGAFFNYLLVAPRLRVYTEVANNSITIPDFFANRFLDDSHLLRIISAVVIIVFFTLYTSSGVVAGGKLFESSFGLSYTAGLYITAGVVVAYTLFGGFMAVSMTDFVQGCIMFIALILVPMVAFMHLGGLGEVGEMVQSQSIKDGVGYNDLFNGVSALSIISLMAWGLGYFGQPHIIVRFMAIRSVKDIPAARNIGMSWMLVTIIGALATGYVGIAYVQKTQMTLDDPETIFIVFSQFLFHPLIGGFLLAAILAAIMSTISSQLLVASSSLTKDVYKLFLRKDASQSELVLIGRASVVLVALVAIALAYNRDSSVLDLVANAWAGFGAAFGPIILLALFWQRLTRNGALAGMVSGSLVVLLWIYGGYTVTGADGEMVALNSWLYAIVPGFLANLVAAVAVSLLGSPKPQMLEAFGEMQRQLKRNSK